MRCGNNNLFALHVCLASAASDAGDNLWEMVSTRGVARQKFGGGMDLGVTMNLGLFSFSLVYFNSKKFIWWELEPVTLPKYAHGVHKSVSKKNCCR